MTEYFYQVKKGNDFWCGGRELIKIKPIKYYAINDKNKTELRANAVDRSNGELVFLRRNATINY